MAEAPSSFSVLPPRETRARLLFLLLTRFWILLFLLGLILYFWITTPGHVFLQTSNLKNIALDTSEVSLLAIGVCPSKAVPQHDIFIAVDDEIDIPRGDAFPPKAAKKELVPRVRKYPRRLTSLLP